MFVVEIVCVSVATDDYYNNNNYLKQIESSKFVNGLKFEKYDQYSV